MADMSSLAKLVISNQQAFSSEVSEVVRSTLLNEFSKQSKEQIQTLVNAYKEDLLNRESKDLIMSWRKECVEGLLQALRSKVDDEFIDDIALLKAVKESLMMIDYPQIAYSKIPDKIKGASGTLKDWEADEFIEVVSNFVSNFQSQVRRDINAFADELEDTFNGVKIGESVFKKLISELTRLESDLKNKAARLDEYKNLERKLQDA